MSLKELKLTYNKKQVMYRYSFLISFMLFFYGANALSLNNNQLHYIHSTIALFIQEHESKGEFKERKSEFMFCILVVDSNGKISQTQFLTNDKNKDSTFKYLCMLTPALFSESFKGCERKSIMIPIVSLSNNKLPDYIKSLIEFYKTIPRSIVSERNNLIVTSLLEYYAPRIIKENPEEKKQEKN